MGSKSGNFAASILMCFCMAPFLIGQFPSASAQAPVGPDKIEVNLAESTEIINKIKAEEPFVNVKNITGWRLKEAEETVEEKDLNPDWLIKIAEILGSIAQAFSFLANAFIALAWFVKIIAVAAVVVLVWLLIRGLSKLNWRFSNSKATRSSKLPEAQAHTLFDLSMDQSDYPEDIPLHVRALITENRLEEALRMLFGACLAKLVSQFNCMFLNGFTESECAKESETKAPTQVSDFVYKLITIWQAYAYAKINPKVSDLTAACDLWNSVFVMDSEQKSSEP